MNYDAAKLYKSIDFLEAVEVLIELQPKTRHYLSKGKVGSTRREIRQTGEGGKKRTRRTI